MTVPGDASDMKVTYSGKELLARIDHRLESIDNKLDSKADIRDVVDLQKRIDRVEKFADESRARITSSNNLFTRWQQVGVLTLMTAAIILQPVIGHFG